MVAEKQQYILFSCFVIIILFLGIIFYHQHTSDVSQQISTFDLGQPTQEPAQKEQSSEPVIVSWRSYSNEKYNFTMDVPKDWFEEDFASAYPNGGTVIAFSPDRLPCESCTYFRNGYFSIKIYNNKTDPEHYADFLKRVSSVGKSPEYQKINLDKKPGVYFANTIAVEQEEWVYELSLDKDDGNATIVDSQIFQKVLSSFKFTYLIFDI